MKILETCENLYWEFFKQSQKEPENFKCNEKTLDAVIDEVKITSPWFIKSKEEMKESGVRYRNILFMVDNSIEDGIILVV